MHAEGQGDVARMLALVAQHVINPEPAFDNITDRLIDAEKRRFRSSGLKDTKDATKQRKARDKSATVRANANRVLVSSGKLEHFLTTKGPGAQPIKLTKDELLFGVPGGRHEFHYARYQAKHGRNPLVSADVVRRWAGRELSAHIFRATGGRHA